MPYKVYKAEPSMGARVHCTVEMHGGHNVTTSACIDCEYYFSIVGHSWGLDAVRDSKQ